MSDEVVTSARAALREALVARQLDEQLTHRYPVGRRLRVLDAGSGRGARALRLARAGHEVTGVEPDPELLAGSHTALAAEPAGIRDRVRFLAGDGRETGAHFLPGAFDVVLAHDLPLGEPDALLAGLARMLAPGGLLSLVVPNVDAAALRPGMTGDLDAVRAALEPGPAERAGRLADLTATLSGIGAPLAAWYGVHVFAPPPEVPGAPFSPELLELEDRAGRTEPYRRAATHLHLCGLRRG
ncbi:class I SAM-dependent methyltransferase [Streptomyces sp. BI20]|uniref:class I SAM-dependent methyltransferase n=1 Tax=Streptomyces sp. BI20 TaxID=3403460 RepID=UPI003C78A199